MDEYKMNDLEKLVGLSLLYRLFKNGDISENTFRSICVEEKELLTRNLVEFSEYANLESENNKLPDGTNS